MNSTQETLRFQAEAQEVLRLMIHSLYKQREIFLRELVSNASDALDKLRFEALTNPALAVGEPKIRIEIDRDARTLALVDNGIGMSREDLVEHLGTIARSGTRQFLERLRAAEGGVQEGASSASVPNLIGQFGVGFYSSFIVADRVTVETRRAGSDQAWRWESTGEGEYTIEPAALDAAGEHGTRITLHLREPGPDDEDTQDFLSEWTIKEVVKRYSDFVAYPIEMETGEEKDRKVEVLNSMRPLWSRPKDDITPEEYVEFYRHVTHDREAPLETIHFRAEGTLEYTALLYVPSHRPLDLFEPTKVQSQIALYVRRVLILADSPDLLPPWLRFVRGIVDSSDLPLNVSRDVLQANPQVRQIKKRLEKRVVEALTALLEKDRGKYETFWSQFGVLMKEGIYVGDDTDGRLSKIALFDSSRGDSSHGDDSGAAGMSTLPEYVARMKSDQKAIYYLAGADRAALLASPHLEAFRKRELEVLLMTDPVDEWVLERLREFDGKPLVAIDRGELELEGDAEKEAREALEREHREMLAAIERELAADVKAVRFTSRLTDSPAVLVNEKGALSPQMERILRAAHQEVRHDKRILELNPDHPLTKRLAEIHAEKPAAEEFREYVELLHGQALLAEGSPLRDAARFAKLVTKMMVARPS